MDVVEKTAFFAFSNRAKTVLYQIIVRLQNIWSLKLREH